MTDGDHRQPLDLGLPAGRGAQVIDDRARQILIYRPKSVSMHPEGGDTVSP